MKTMMKRLGASVAALALGVATPLAAQETQSSDEPTEEEMAMVMGMLGGIFVAEPLTAEQEARLPLAQKVTAQMMPVGFYEEIMADVMQATLGPILGMFSGPDFVVMGAVSLDEGLPELSSEQMAELASAFDPDYANRGEAMVSALTEGMGGFMAVMEDPMRDGLAKAYAARFTGEQLSEIDAFFQTPTGGLFAKESMAIAADPQFMNSIMQAMPTMMAGMGDFEAEMEAAMAEFETPPSFDAMPASDRAKAARLLGISETELKDAMERAAAEQAAAEQMDWDDEWADDDDWSDDGSAEEAAEGAAEEAVE